MRRLVSAVIAFALLSCGAEETAQKALPSVADVDRLETVLASQPCIGPLDAWERTYKFHRAGDGTVVQDQIEFNLRKAGSYGVRSRRQIITPGLPGIDDTPVKMAWGVFNRSNGRLSVSFCGQNAGG